MSCDWSVKCPYCSELFIGRSGLVTRTFHLIIHHGDRFGDKS